MSTTSQSTRDGFNKGYSGAEETAAQARTLLSPEPLTNEMKAFKKLYIVCIAAAVIGLVFRPLLGIAVLGALVVYCIDSAITDHKRARLRRFKFTLLHPVTNEELFPVIMPVLTSTYGMLIEKREDGLISASHQGYIYDIVLNDDQTFCVWWRLSGIGLFTKINKYKSYRTILAAMGIIGFEVQKAVNAIPAQIPVDSDNEEAVSS